MIIGGIFFSSLQALTLYGLWRSYGDPYPTIIILPALILYTIFLFVLSEKLYKRKVWAWQVAFWLFLILTIGDTVYVLFASFNIGLLIIGVIHGVAAYLLYSGKQTYMATEDYPPTV